MTKAGGAKAERRQTFVYKHGNAADAKPDGPSGGAAGKKENEVGSLTRIRPVCATPSRWWA